MRRMVLRSLVLSSVVLSMAIAGASVSAGSPIDLPSFDITYDDLSPIIGHGHWVLGLHGGGEWRVVGSQLGEDDRLTLDLEIRPPAISVPLEPGPAVLFGRLELYGGYPGDVGASAEVPGSVAQALAPCPDPSDCVYRGSITLPTDRLPRLAARYPEAGWSSAVIGLTLVRTFAQGTWLQVLPLYDGRREEPDGTVGQPLPISSRMTVNGAFPVGPRELWGRREQPVLERIERLRRSLDDPSALPETQPFLVDIETAPCTHGWTIATVTGDTLVDTRKRGRSVPVRVEAPVGTEWLVSVPGIDRAHSIGALSDTSGPFRSDGAMAVSGSVAGDPYLCAGADPGSVTWRPATDEEVAAFEEGDPASLLHTYATLPARDLPTTSSPFEPFWRPLGAEDIPFAYSCGGLTFTASDLASAAPTSGVSDALATVIYEVGRQISDDDADWYVVRQTDEAAVAFSPYPTVVDVQNLSRTDDGWRFRTGGGGCEPRAVFGDAGAGRWRLDPAFPAPDPTTRTLHVLGYLACNGTAPDGKARIELTPKAALIAIPMRSTVGDRHEGCLGPTPMTVTLPEPLGQRTLYDAGSLPLGGANEKLDIDRTDTSGSGG